MYHLTFSNIGKNATLIPSVSEDRAESEIDTPRVCASPTIEECIIALKSCERFKEAKENSTLCLFVYKVNADNFMPYTNVFDFENTREHISFNSEDATLEAIIHIPRLSTMKYLGETFKVEKANCVYEFISEEIFNEYYAK